MLAALFTPLGSVHGATMRQVLGARRGKAPVHRPACFRGERRERAHGRFALCTGFVVRAPELDAPSRPPTNFFFFCVLRDPKSDVKRSSFPRLNEGIVGVIHRRSAQVDFPPVAEMLSFLWHSVSPFCEFD